MYKHKQIKLYVKIIGRLPGFVKTKIVLYKDYPNFTGRKMTLGEDSFKNDYIKVSDTINSEIIFKKDLKC